MAGKYHRWLKRNRRKLGSYLMPRVAPFVLRRLSGSWDVEILGQEHRDETESTEGCLWTLWHGRMIVGITDSEDTGNTVLVSPSKDGDLMDTLLPRFGLRTIRGSSSRSGPQALRAMLRSLKGGGTVVVTPDGPRGPRHSGSAGVVWLARATGYPIQPCGFVAEPAWRMRSWDGFTIPKWGAKVKLSFGEPLYVPRDADKDEIKRLNAELLRRNMQAEADGFKLLGVEPDWPAEDIERYWTKT